MPSLDSSNFNIVCAVLGGFTAVFGLVSYLAKEKFYLSEALISFGAGILFGPAAGWIRPLGYAGDEENLELINRNFTRLVLGVQLVIAGIQLPPKYLKTEWKSLAYLLGPGMTLMWLFSSMLVWALVPHITFLYALAVGACVTPTDPVLSASIVKGKFADKHLPRSLQNLVIAESGANDGLGYPFLYLPLYLIQYIGKGAYGGHSAGKSIGLWFYETWCYEILLSLLYGTVVGLVAKYLLRWAEERNYVDDEEFLIFALAMAIFIIGTDGLIGSDDVLACFAAGNAFTWDDWFRQKTQNDSLQPSLDLLLNVAVFVWFGAVCPWHSFNHNSIVPIYRLIPLGILILLVRRPPVLFLLHKLIHQTERWRQATIVGFFGPIGVGAIFYLSVSQEFLRTEMLDENGNEREDAVRLRETMTVVIWFLVVCSIIVHGLTIPLVKLGVQVPRQLGDGKDEDIAEKGAAAPEPGEHQSHPEHEDQDTSHLRPEHMVNQSNPSGQRPDKDK